MNIIIEKESLEQLLPQKFPFVMVTALCDYSENTLVSGLKVNEDNIFYHDGILLESGLIEHMAQSVALHTGYSFFLRDEPAPTGYIGSIKEVQILKLPRLNQEIKTTVTILQEFAGITLVDLTSRIDDEVIATGQMKTILAK
jgi:predicted hotdog family 3-hydroxylacyl-ACP dehydratase